MPRDETPEEFIQRFCPTLTYCVPKRYVDALRRTFGVWLFWNGVKFEIVTRSLGAGWYEVTGRRMEHGKA